jgi:hypothetical protein
LIVLHLVVAALLRTIMRRAGVDPWIATAAASLFVFFGSGHQNVLWAFQIGFTGALMFGLVQLILSDHDGSIDRRDGLALVAGVAGLLCSGVALTLALVVGIAVFARRGWRAALFQTAPLATVYLIWWLRYGRDAYFTERGRASTPHELVSFIRIGLMSAFDAMGQVYGIGWVFFGVLLAGGVVAVRRCRDAQALHRLAAPGALLLGAVVFLTLSGLGRAVFGPELARLHDRYLHIVTALALPAIAVGADAITRRFRVPVVVMTLLLAIGIPGNIHAFAVARDRETPFQQAFRRQTLELAHLPIADDVPRSVRPQPLLAKPITMGWLRDGVRDGRIPSTDPPSARAAAGLTLRVMLEQRTSSVARASCHTLTGAEVLDVDRGDVIVIQGRPVTVQLLAKVPSNPSTFEPARGTTLVVHAGPNRLRIAPAPETDPAFMRALSPADPRRPAVVCR